MNYLIIDIDHINCFKNKRNEQIERLYNYCRTKRKILIGYQSSTHFKPNHKPSGSTTYRIITDCDIFLGYNLNDKILYIIKNRFAYDSMSMADPDYDIIKYGGFVNANSKCVTYQNFLKNLKKRVNFCPDGLFEYEELKVLQ